MLRRSRSAIKLLVEVCEVAPPVVDRAMWADHLQREIEDTMLVGHLPYLERLVSRLLVGDPGRRVVAFRNAGAVCLERGEDGRWMVGWSLTPETV